MILTGLEEVYADEADASAAGVDADDETLELASRAVDDYCGRNFGPPFTRTVTVHDVRTPVVPLPGPFTNVTAVTVNGGAPLDAGAYAIEPWGVRLYSSSRDADGFPAHSFVSGPWGLYGGRVAVTASFGWDEIPAAVRRATILLAGHLRANHYRVTATATDAEGNPTILPVSAAIPKDTLVGPDADRPMVDSTGLIDADRLLAPYRRVRVG